MISPRIDTKADMPAPKMDTCAFSLSTLDLNLSRPLLAAGMQGGVLAAVMAFHDDSRGEIDDGAGPHRCFEVLLGAQQLRDADGEA